MELKVYQNQIARLKNTYGADSYPQGCVEAIWKQVKHCSEARFIAAIDRVMSDNVNPRFAPGIGKIEAALSHIRESDHKQDKRSWSEEYGNLCKGNQKFLSGDEVQWQLRQYIKDLGSAS